MGMDVTGIGNPDAYFRANIWAWAPILNVMKETCADLLPAETLEAMGSNDGAGPKSNRICLEMAARIEAWVTPRKKAGVNRFMVTGDLAPEGTRAFADAFREMFGDVNENYTVDVGHLMAFVEFLKICKGFQVW